MDGYSLTFPPKPTSKLMKLTVALDWTPNTNHSGLYVALSLGLYEAAGLEVILQTPESAGSGGLTPNACECKGLSASKQVATGLAHFGVCPQESVVSYSTTDKWRHVDLVAVAALCQGHMSSISVLASSGIARPRDLANGSYASYGARFEDAIVRRLVENDGGDGAKMECRPVLLKNNDNEVTGLEITGSVVATHLAKGLADAAWIFPHWEGVLASRADQALNHFHFKDYNMLHGYCPILIASRGTADTPYARAFLKATAEGYKIAAADPAAAARALGETGHPSLADKEFVLASAESIKGCYLDQEGRWGRIERGRWKEFVDFMDEAKVLVDREGKAIGRDKVDADRLFTNKALPE